MPVVNCQFCGRDTRSKSGLCRDCNTDRIRNVAGSDCNRGYEYGDKLPPSGRDRDVAIEVKDFIDNLLN